MRELNLDQLRTLVSIADLGTFSAAAQALHLAQPTVSLHVSELESRLGVPLVLRGGRRVEPTAAGAVLVERARRLLRDADDAVDAVQRHAKGSIGRVRLATTTGLLVNMLPRVLEAMAASHPGVDVQVSILGTSDAIAQLEQGVLDVGLVAAPGALATLVSSPWRRDPMVAYLPAAWPAPKRVSPQWLAERPLIFTGASTQLYRQTMEWFAQGGCAPRGRIELNYTAAVKSLVAAGYGAAVLPLEGESPGQASPGLKTAQLTPALTRHTVVVHRPLPALDGATRNLLDTLAQFRQR